jgi:hypothetical protein
MILEFLDTFSRLTTIIVILTAMCAIVGWVNGVWPAIYRIGNGFARRKIAIFAKADNAISLKDLLIDSKLFKNKNIFVITKKEDLGKAEEASIYLVQWHDWSSDISEILSKKTDKCAMVVYAPFGGERISDEQMQNLDSKRYTTVANFRGRLLNDIVTSMITTNYEER